MKDIHQYLVNFFSLVAGEISKKALKLEFRNSQQVVAPRQARDLIIFIETKEWGERKEF